MEPFIDLLIIFGVTTVVGLLWGMWTSRQPLGEADEGKTGRS